MGSQIGQTEFTGQYRYETVYSYSDYVLQNDDFLRVIPHADDHTFLDSYEVVTSPPSAYVEFNDAYGNIVRRIKVTTRHRELSIVSQGRFRLLPWRGPYPDSPVQNMKFNQDVTDFLSPSPLVKPYLLRDLALKVAGDSNSLLDTVGRITQWVHDNIKYQKGTTTVLTEAHQVLANGSGVCQDKVHLALGVLRALWIPSRYVSCILTEQDGDTHAYLEFLHPVCGWLPADPTKGILVDAGTKYLKLAVGRDYTDVSPVSGTFLSTGTGGLSRVYASAIRINTY
jgi:transglutaminase-like putative cysteine protease